MLISVFLKETFFFKKEQPPYGLFRTSPSHPVQLTSTCEWPQIRANSLHDNGLRVTTLFSGGLRNEKDLVFIVLVIHPNIMLHMWVINFTDVYPKICQDLFLFTRQKGNGPSHLCPFQTTHLRRPEISTGFIPNVNNALKVSDRLEKSTPSGVCIYQSIVDSCNTQNLRSK